MNEMQTFLVGSMAAFVMGFLTCFVLTLGIPTKKGKR